MSALKKAGEDKMQVTGTQFLIVLPLVFLAGLVDAIGGGGGLISLPAYILSGVPVHMAIGTNKLSSGCGTTVATFRFIRRGLVNWKLAIPSMVVALGASSLGAKLSLLANEKILMTILLFVLPAAAILVMNRKFFPDTDIPAAITKKVYLVSLLSALLIGIYDGFYGPGTGSFLIIAFTAMAKLSVSQANGQAKIINWTTNVTSIVVFLLSGNVIFLLGVPAAVCNMLGGYIGAGLAMKNGARIVRPSILIVLVLMIVKIVSEHIVH